MGLVEAPKTQPVSRFKNGNAQLNKLRWLIYGAPGAGKTRLAATIGEKDGSNVIWIALDTNPATTLLMSGYGVPHMLDLQAIMTEEKKTFLQVIPLLKPEIDALIATDPTRQWRIVFDGLTLANTYLSSEIAAREPDTQKMWMGIQSALTSLWSTLNAYQYPLVWVAHAGEVAVDVRDKTGENAKIRNEVAGTTAEERVKPDLVGKNVNLFINQVDIAAFLKKMETPKGEVVRKLYTDGGAVARGKTRFESVLPEIIDNPNLSVLVDTIKSHVK